MQTTTALWAATIILVFTLGILTTITYQQLTPRELPPAPGDHISEDNIYQTNNTIIIKIDQPFYLSKYTPTHSMLPLIEEGHNGIMIKPQGQDIQVGDIISYKYDENTTIVHRVISIKKDKKGYYFITKGDNNPQQDPFKIRMENIQGILIGIIY